MAWADHIARREAGLAMLMTIDGIPIVFSSLRSCPWGACTIDGETYAWSDTIAPSDEIDGCERKVEPWGGVGVGGSVGVIVRRDAVWDGLRNLSIHRGCQAVVVADAASTDTSIECDDLTGWPASGTAYIGAETITYTGITDATLTGCTRGCWGSRAAEIRATTTRSEYGGGPRVSTHSLTMQRQAHVWLIGGSWDRGVFTPNGATPCSAEDREIHSGQIVDIREDREIQTLTLTLGDLLDLLDSTAGNRLPRGIAGVPADWEVIHIGPGSDMVDHDWAQTETATALTGHITGTPLMYPVAGVPTVVPQGLYPAQDVASWLAYTLALTAPVAGTVSCDVWMEYPEGVPTWRVRVQSDTSTSPEDGWMLTLLSTPRSVWAQLGFSEDVATLPWTSTDSSLVWDFTATRQAPRFRWPLDAGGGRSLYYVLADSTLPLDTAPGWVDDDGATIGAYVRIGDAEVVHASANAVWTVWATDVPYLVECDRGVLGSRLTEEVYVTDDDDPCEITQILAFPRCTWPRALAYLLEGYDPTWRGWRGACAGVDTRYVDTAALAALASDIPWRACVVVGSKRSVREIMQDLLVLDQSSLVASVGSTGRQQLVPYRLRAPLEADDASAVTIDASVLTEGSGLTYEVCERGLVNVIRGTRAGVDWSTEDGEGREIEYRAVTSIATWGEGEALTLDLAMLGTWQEAYDLLTGQLAQRIHALWGAPYARIEATIGERLIGWETAPMTHVLVSHDRLPSMTTVGRGETMPAMVYGVTPVWRGASRGRMLLICSTPGGERVSAYAPSAYGSAVSGTGITCLDHAYSRASEALDASRFPAGTRVRVYRPGSESSAVSRVIDAIVPGGADATILVTTVACGLAAPVIVELDTYDTAGATDAQRAYAHLSDGDRTVGGDPSFEYL